MKNSMKTKLSFVLCIVLIAAMALFATGCNDTTDPTGSTAATTQPTEAPAPSTGSTEPSSEETEPSTGATEPSTGATEPSDVTVVGEGATSFNFIVTDVDGTETKFRVSTDKTTVGEALLELGLLEGEMGDYGLYVLAVNGITADWETESAYWAFYVDGEYGTTGVDLTEITADATYSFVKTVSAD